MGQERRQRREKGDVEGHDRAQEDDETPHPATVASGFARYLVLNHTRFH
jgi:hypothetical protein